jgi:hypothetical protein
MNTPQALAVLWETAKSNIPPGDKRDLILDFDTVLGLQLDVVLSTTQQTIPAEIVELAKERSITKSFYSVKPI